MKRFKIKMKIVMLLIVWAILFVPCTVSLTASAVLEWFGGRILKWMKKRVRHLKKKNNATEE